MRILVIMILSLGLCRPSSALDSNDPIPEEQQNHYINLYAWLKNADAIIKDSSRLAKDHPSLDKRWLKTREQLKGRADLHPKVLKMRDSLEALLAKLPAPSDYEALLARARLGEDWFSALLSEHAALWQPAAADKRGAFAKAGAPGPDGRPAPLDLDELKALLAAVPAAHAKAQAKAREREQAERLAAPARGLDKARALLAAGNKTSARLALAELFDGGAVLAELLAKDPSAFASFKKDSQKLYASLYDSPYSAFLSLAKLPPQVKDALAEAPVQASVVAMPAGFRTPPPPPAPPAPSGDAGARLLERARGEFAKYAGGPYMPEEKERLKAKTFAALEKDLLDLRVRRAAALLKTLIRETSGQARTLHERYLEPYGRYSALSEPERSANLDSWLTWLNSRESLAESGRPEFELLRLDADRQHALRREALAAGLYPPYTAFTPESLGLDPAKTRKVLTERVDGRLGVTYFPTDRSQPREFISPDGYRRREWGQGAKVEESDPAGGSYRLSRGKEEVLSWSRKAGAVSGRFRGLDFSLKPGEECLPDRDAEQLLVFKPYPRLVHRLAPGSKGNLVEIRDLPEGLGWLIGGVAFEFDAKGLAKALKNKRAKALSSIPERVKEEGVPVLDPEMAAQLGGFLNDLGMMFPEFLEKLNGGAKVGIGDGILRVAYGAWRFDVKATDGAAPQVAVVHPAHKECLLHFNEDDRAWELHKIIQDAETTRTELVGRWKRGSDGRLAYDKPVVVDKIWDLRWKAFREEVAKRAEPLTSLFSVPQSGLSRVAGQTGRLGAGLAGLFGDEADAAVAKVYACYTRSQDMLSEALSKSEAEGLGVSPESVVYRSCLGSLSPSGRAAVQAYLDYELAERAKIVLPDGAVRAAASQGGDRDAERAVMAAQRFGLKNIAPVLMRLARESGKNGDAAKALLLRLGAVGYQLGEGYMTGQFIAGLTNPVRLAAAERLASASKGTIAGLTAEQRTARMHALLAGGEAAVLSAPLAVDVAASARGAINAKNAREREEELDKTALGYADLRGIRSGHKNKAGAKAAKDAGYGSNCPGGVCSAKKDYFRRGDEDAALDRAGNNPAKFNDEIIRELVQAHQSGEKVVGDISSGRINLQSGQECFAQALYWSPESKPIQKVMLYPTFLKTADAITRAAAAEDGRPFQPIREAGLTPQLAGRVVGEMGLTLNKNLTELADPGMLVARLKASGGALLGGIGVPTSAGVQGHMVLIVAARPTGPAGDWTFIVRDSNLSRLQKYTFAQLKALSLETFSLGRQEASPMRPYSDDQISALAAKTLAGAARSPAAAAGPAGPGYGAGLRGHEPRVKLLEGKRPKVELVNPEKADQPHEVPQGRELAELLGGGKVSFLGDSHQGIEGYFTPPAFNHSPNRPIPISLKDESRTGPLRNITDVIRENAGQLLPEDRGRVLLYSRVPQFSTVQVAAMIVADRTVNGILASHGPHGFRRLLFLCSDGVVEVKEGQVLVHAHHGTRPEPRKIKRRRDRPARAA